MSRASAIFPWVRLSFRDFPALNSSSAAFSFAHSSFSHWEISRFLSLMCEGYSRRR